MRYSAETNHRRVTSLKANIWESVDATFRFLTSRRRSRDARAFNRDTRVCRIADCGADVRLLICGLPGRHLSLWLHMGNSGGVRSYWDCRLSRPQNPRRWTRVDGPLILAPLARVARQIRVIRQVGPLSSRVLAGWANASPATAVNPPLILLGYLRPDQRVGLYIEDIVGGWTARKYRRFGNTSYTIYI